MKKSVLLIINAILAVAIIGLYILHFTNRDNDNKETIVVSSTVESKTAKENLPIAYVNVDSFLLKYTFAKEANEKLFSKSQKAQAELSSEMKKWQTDAMEFQKKVQSKAFLSEERAQQESNRLMKKQQELEALDARLSRDLMKEQEKIHKQLHDSLFTFLKGYCEERSIQIVLGNLNDDVLYSQKHQNITNDVITEMNKRIQKK
jgi:outer membrane protein